ncbi:MAG TPA: GAF domain-containing protein [Anaerolineales bacterium]|nr:GAF domain-containing protein [Anaerolineales bacterium]
MISIPVVITSWFYYKRAGVIASIFAILINLILIQIFIQEPDRHRFDITSPDLIIENIFLILVSFGTGYLREEIEHLHRWEQQLQSRERFLTLLGMIVRKILEHSSWNALNDNNSNLLFFDIINHLTNLFVADYGHIIRWDSARTKAHLIASTNSAEVPPAHYELDPQEVKIAEDALQAGQVLAIEDLPNSPHIANLGEGIQPMSRIQSTLCIPLIAREHQFGAVILAYQTTRQFTGEEITYAERIGYQVALALWGLRQDQIISQQLNETLTMMKIGQALGETERIGLNTVLQLIVDSARKLIPQAEKAVIHLVDEDNKSLIPQAISGFHESEKFIPNLKMHVGSGVAGQVLREGVTINIADVTTDPRFLQKDIQPAYRSLLVAPIQTASRQLGTISVESEKLDAFSEHEAELLEALGNQAAVAIENTSLFENTQQSLKEMNALYLINQRLAASLDADILMKEVVNLLQQSFHYYHVQVYLISSEQRDSVLRQGSGDIGTQLKSISHRLLPGEGIVGHVAYTSKPFVTNDVDKVIFFVRNPLLPDTKSELATPIKIDEQVLGVLDIQQIPPYTLTESDLQIASAVAEQLAVALQKAQLYANLQTALQHEQTMRSQLVQSERLALMGKLLASVSHELNNPLQTIQNALFLIRDELQHSGNNLEELDIISSEMDRMVMLLERLRSTYRPLHPEEFKPVQINDIIEDVYKLISTHLRHKNISFELHPDQNLPPVTGFADHLKQVILNLFINAVEAMPEGGHLCIDTYMLTASNEVVFSIMDNGMGIEPELLPRIFDPFVTSKDTGTGLGLTITYEIIEQHGGRILAENAPTGGAKFTIWLPIWGGNNT